MDKDLEKFMARRAAAEGAEPPVDPAEVRLGGEGDASDGPPPLPPSVPPGEIELPGISSNTSNRIVRPEGTRPCPICGATMSTTQEFGVMFDVCVDHGVWLDRGELEALADRRTRTSRDVMRATIKDLRHRQFWDYGYRRRPTLPEVLFDLLFDRR